VLPKAVPVDPAKLAELASCVAERQPPIPEETEQNRTALFQPIRCTGKRPFVSESD
jgi:hypothetical protein